MRLHTITSSGCRILLGSAPGSALRRQLVRFGGNSDHSSTILRIEQRVRKLACVQTRTSVFRMHSESHGLLRASRNDSGGDLSADPLTVPVFPERSIWDSAASR